MTLSEIYFNYNQAISQANELDSIAKKAKQAANTDLQQIMNNVSSAWKSDNSNNYLKKGEKVGNDIRTTATNLTKIATAIRTIAKRVRDAELEAWRIANARK